MMNKNHLDKFEKIMAWAKQKEAYLNVREEIHSVSASQVGKLDNFFFPQPFPLLFVFIAQIIVAYQLVGSLCEREGEPDLNQRCRTEEAWQ